MAFSDCSGGYSRPFGSRLSDEGYAYSATPEALPNSGCLAFRHAMLSDSAEISGVLALARSYLLPSRRFDPVGPRTIP